MPAPDLLDLMWRYALRGLADWNDAPSELKRRAAACLANQIAEEEYQATITIHTSYTGANADVFRFIPMPFLGMKGIESCFFLPIRETQEDGSSLVSFDLFMLVAERNCLAFRFEPADPPGRRHSYTHVQFCRQLVRKTVLLDDLPSWLPDSYPAFPVSASNPIELFLAMVTAIHGYHGGIMTLLLEIFVGLPNDAKHYADELHSMLVG